MKRMRKSVKCARLRKYSSIFYRMAKKTTMKRKMKKRGTRRCWGGGPESKSKTPVTKSSSGRISKRTEKGQEYAEEQLQNTLRQQYNKHMKTKVDDLTEAFGSASISTPK